LKFRWELSNPGLATCCFGNAKESQKAQAANRKIGEAAGFGDGSGFEMGATQGEHDAPWMHYLKNVGARAHQHTVLRTRTAMPARSALLLFSFLYSHYGVGLPESAPQ
jgi:hypothetical protein